MSFMHSPIAISLIEPCFVGRILMLLPKEQQLVLAVERLRGENIEGMVDRTMARSLAQQEWNAVKAKHEVDSPVTIAMTAGPRRL